MANARSRGGAPTGETHARKSRTRESGSGASQSDASLSDTRQAMHFTELSGAFNFIADSLRRNVLHPDP
jgi:hypothetical protein